MYAVVLFSITGILAFIGWIADNEKENARKKHEELTRVVPITTIEPDIQTHVGQIVAFRGSAIGEPLQLPHLGIDVICYKIKHFTESIEFNPITKRLENNSVYKKTSKYGEEHRLYLQDGFSQVEVTELPRTDIKLVKLGEHFERIEDNANFNTNISWNSILGLSVTTSNEQPHNRIIGENLIYEGLRIGTELTAIGHLHITNDGRVKLLTPGSISQKRLETQIEEARANAESSIGRNAWNLAKFIFILGCISMIFNPGPRIIF